MTSKIHRRLLSILAGVVILLLLTIMIVLWVCVGQGAFRTKEQPPVYNATVKQTEPIEDFFVKAARKQQQQGQ